MTKLEELKVARDDAWAAADADDAWDAYDDACVASCAAADAASEAYQDELEKTQEENTND